MKKYHLMVTAVLISYCSHSFAGAPKQPKISYGGFYAGMTKTAAKAVGYGDCAYGIGPAERKEDIYCDIPPAKRTLNTLKITKAKLIFKAPNLEQVHEIRIDVNSDIFVVRKALATQYGPEYGATGFWIGDTPHIIHMNMFKSGLRGIITFSFDPKLHQRLKNQLEAKSKNEKIQSQILKSF